MAKMDWRKAKIYIPENFEFSENQEKSFKAEDSKWLRKHKNKIRKIAKIKNGEMRARKSRGRKSKEERRATREARRLSRKLDKQMDNALL